MTKNQNKTLEQIINQGRNEKQAIDNRIKRAKAKAGRAYYIFLHNYGVGVKKYNNGRIKMMALAGKNNNVVILRNGNIIDNSATSATPSEATRLDYQSATNSNQSSISSSSSDNPFSESDNQ